jgi:VWFA-related protein
MLPLCSRRQLILTLLPAAAMSAQEQPTFSVDVKVVNLLVTVRGPRGELLRDLSQDEFTVLENGRPQTIRYFARESDLPLTIGLLIDTSLSQKRILNAERGASFRFIDQVLRERTDRFFVMQFDLGILVHQPPTDSRRLLEEALSQVGTPTRRELEMQTGGGTLLYEAVMRAARDIMAGQGNRKALIILSDGGENGSIASQTEAIEAALRADTLLYSIFFTGGGPDGRQNLVTLSKETGGSYFEVSKKQPIDAVFAAIQDELRGQYSIGYVSADPVRMATFRRLQVTTARPMTKVQTRNRYWAAK